MMKRPAAASAPSVTGWEDFAVMPYSNPDASDEAAGSYGHLKLHPEMTKAPAVVKHIQNGTLNSAPGCQSVKDFLRSLDKKGDPTWLEAWDNANHANKKLIIERMKVELDEKNLLTVTHKTSAGKRTKTTEIRGWMSLWEVADVEKVPFDPKYNTVLMDLISGDQSRVHENAALAAKGWRQYYHVKNKAEQEDVYHEVKFTAKSERAADGEEDYEAARTAIGIAGGVMKNNAKNTRQVADASKPEMSAWKARADEMLGRLSAESNSAHQLAMDIEQALVKKSNQAVAKKHSVLATHWAKKIDNKKSQLLKGSSMATHAKDAIFKQSDNKFDELITSSEEMLKEWASSDNKELLLKLMAF